MVINKLWYIIALLLLVIIGQYEYYQKPVEPITIHEGREQVYRELAAKEKLRGDSLNKIVKILDSITLVKENYIPTITKQRNEKINSITLLNANDQIKLFAKYTASADTI